MAAQYHWESSKNIGKEAVIAVTDFLKSAAASSHLFQTESICSVEDDPIYRNKEIDLLWVAPIKGKSDRMTIEVKGDQNYQTGNFFLETISDLSRKTPGAFLCCQADWFFYYFLNVEILFCMPTNLTRAWFSENISRFKERETSSRRGAWIWKTRGSLVPIRTLLDEVGCIPCFRRKENLWYSVNDINRLDG